MDEVGDCFINGIRWNGKENFYYLLETHGSYWVSLEIDEYKYFHGYGALCRHVEISLCKCVVSPMIQLIRISLVVLPLKSKRKERTFLLQIQPVYVTRLAISIKASTAQGKPEWWGWLVGQGAPGCGLWALASLPGTQETRAHSSSGSSRL